MSSRAHTPAAKPAPVLFRSPEFVLCAGCILFYYARPPPLLNGDDDTSHHPAAGLRVCILHHLGKDEWVLAKGRKDAGEVLDVAALRETFEESSYRCSLLPVNIRTRAPPRGVNIKDDAAGWFAERSKEAFMVTQRTMGPQNVKLTFWYVASADVMSADGEILPFEAGADTEPEKVPNTQTDTENFDSVFLDVDEALARLTFEGDRQVVLQAADLVRATYFT